MWSSPRTSLEAAVYRVPLLPRPLYLIASKSSYRFNQWAQPVSFGNLKDIVIGRFRWHPSVGCLPPPSPISTRRGRLRTELLRKTFQTTSQTQDDPFFHLIMSTATSASPSAGGAAPMLPANATIEQAVEALKRDGYCILPNALPDDLCTKYLDCIKRYMKGEWPRSLENPFHGKKTHRFFDLLNADDVWQELPVQPKILGIAQRILGNDCQLTTYGTVSIGPGEPAQHIHTDDIVYKLNRPHGDLYMNIIFAISDFNERNGATHVLPGSNHLPYE